MKLLVSWLLIKENLFFASIAAVGSIIATGAGASSATYGVICVMVVTSLELLVNQLQEITDRGGVKSTA